MSICLQWLCVKLSTGGCEEVVGINIAATCFFVHMPKELDRAATQTSFSRNDFLLYQPLNLG